MYCQNVVIREPNKINFRKSSLDEVIHSCSLCELSKSANNKVIGSINTESRITFITLKPIVKYSASFEMISNISNRVFEEEFYNTLSLIKCNTHLQIKDEHAIVCMEYLKSQIDNLNPKLIIIFGIDSAKYLIGGDEKLEDLRGRVLNNLLDKQRDFIVTYSISDLLKNQSFKKAAMEDFKIAKIYLKGCK
ncbi:uracil-DNA glycosylase family protein [Helicobacter sp. MIT 14-3879]|uniref:uracil-DNA glycosylase family protein n=1 Tax=Helicobacter sp. MIT 14-3879 TaxID=2040649 RepID=UPI0015F15F7B|nr:uracil-DNA glycosylase family protein [Helicobacter sp. MIT 14-3879]